MLHIAGWAILGGLAVGAIMIWLAPFNYYNEVIALFRPSH